MPGAPGLLDRRGPADDVAPLVDHREVRRVHAFLFLERDRREPDLGVKAGDVEGQRVAGRRGRHA